MVLDERHYNFGFHKTSVPQLTRLTPQQALDERRKKGLCFNCGSKYIKGHKCSEKKSFYIDYEEEEDNESEPQQDLKETTPKIYCHALDDINTPQTLKIQGYIKNKKVTVLVDYGSIYNFINYKLEKYLNCFVYPAPKFQVIIGDGGAINCSRKFHSIKLNMEEHFLDSPKITIQMGGVYVVLGVQWLQSLGTILALNFQYIFMRFSLDGKEIELIGIQGKPYKVISSNTMTKLLKKGHHCVVSQLCSLDVKSSISSPPLHQIVINNHSKVFGEIPKVFPHACDHDHLIHLQPRIVPPIIIP
jgi:hypothetical protein